MKAQLFHLHAISPLHVGVGQAIGVVDLPIARDRASNIPIIPGSGLKGALREDLAWNQGKKDEEHGKIMQQLFGPDNAPEEAWAGALAFGDAHLLMLPVRSFNGIMALVTCPFVLERYATDLKRTGQQSFEVPPVPANTILTSNDTPNAINGKVILEDLDLSKIDNNPHWKNWSAHIADIVFADGRKAAMQQRMALVDNDTFVFLSETATDIRARIAINNDTGVVSNGALWYEENLPVESILWGTLGVGRNRSSKHGTQHQDMQQAWQQLFGAERLLQIGGKSTIGRGLVRWINGGGQ